MASLTITHSAYGSNFDEYIVKSTIVRFRKHRMKGMSEDHPDIAEIHLSNGDVIFSQDSLKTLNAKLNSDS